MRKTVLPVVLAMLMVLGWAGVASAGIFDLVEQLPPYNAAGPQSTAEINHTYIDLTNISTGEVTAQTYVGAGQSLTTNNFNVQEQGQDTAMNKLTEFVFELTNRYRPGTDLALTGTGHLPSVHVYVYGTMKDEVIWAVVNGLVDCLGNPPAQTSPQAKEDKEQGKTTWIEKYSPGEIETTIATSTFTINTTAYTVAGQVYTMDAAPEIVSDRTFVPVRYLAYSLGVPESGITWEQETQQVTIIRNDTIIGLTIGSNTATVNGESVQMEAAPYIKDGRTMLPARYVAEPLGAEVTWDEATRQVTIEIPQGQS